MAKCRVFNCRFAECHLTSFHQCGTCGLFGHGKTECKNDKKKQELASHYSDTYSHSEQCKVLGCKYPKNHKTIGHCCLYCGKRTSCNSQCPTNTFVNNPNYTSLDESLLFNSRIQKMPKKRYCVIFGDLGSIWYVKKNKSNEIKYFLLHQDRQGQYSFSDIPMLNKFLLGYSFFIK
jgi:hypothetical protein